ncbi:hypothetical protein NQ318_018676 [Aromia moschata]|uniref:Amine oxidase domain-containing protein n=1 Tax=Aromia moschata TaxID=1265417 RepID=A0AAV8ZGW5_9CUCU|nr:hypothetical protein NQ318_018676 [Aromia moschata]
MKISLPIYFVFLARFVLTIGPNDPSIIIIGAGPAGIAALTKLVENGFENVLVLEAEPRIGGRVNSVLFGDAYVDLGAEWCHGEKDNMVYELVKDFNVLGHSDYSYELYHSSGMQFDRELSEELEAMRASYFSSDGRRYEKNYNNSIYEKFGNDERKLELASEALEFFLHFVLSSEGAFSWFDPAAESDYRDCEGRSSTKLERSWLQDHSGNPPEELPIDDKILLNKEVTSIHWDANSGRKTIISCSDGSVYTADHVIFTPSVGVFKRKRLPYEKLEAIENIGLGAVLKVAMLFSTNWWGNETNFNFVWSEEDKRSLLTRFTEDPYLNGDYWLTNLFTVVKVERNPRVLVAWFTGDMVPVIELMPEDRVINGIHYALNKFLGNKFRISKVDRIVRSQWYSNPHFRGVYSFQTTKSKRSSLGTKSSEDELAEPLRDFRNMPKIQFAGEATHPYYFSTVHGAIETGYREANRLIDFYRKIVHEKYGHDKGTLKLALEAMNFFLHLILANEGSFSCFDSAALTDFEDCPGDQQLNWNGRGFKTILYILMRKYPDPSKQLPMDDKIIFNKEVATVNWDQNSEGKVVVSCVDGSIFTADHVIFTPSIGVLKQRALSMFNPRLPINKLEAIDVIGIGAVAKVVMLFSSNWWGNETNFNFLWTEEDSKLLSSKFPGSVNSVSMQNFEVMIADKLFRQTSRTWLTDLTALTKVEQNPRVLMAWFTGEMVPVVELLPEETLIQGIIYMLNKVLGKTYSITKLNKITRSMWYSNPHFRGGYSFQTVRTRRASQDGTSSEDDLAEPLWDSRNRMVLHFAGEATHPTHYGTVHGAMETGYREAERIIDMYS